MVVRRTALVVIVLQLFAACSSDDFGRNDAIAALTSTGLTEVESTCVADALAVLGQLSAADPRDPRGAEQRTALVSATSHCVALQPIAGSAASTAETTIEEDDDPEGRPFGSVDVMPSDDALADLRQTAIAHLELSGRSAANARCVVDQLIGMEAGAVLADPGFGLGLDPVEADAFAACS